MDDIARNGLRWYFYESYCSKKVSNVREFARLAGVARSSMQRYLKDGNPRNENVLRDIERNLGKPMFDINIQRPLINWKELEPILYANKPTLRKEHLYDYETEEHLYARESITEEEQSLNLLYYKRRCEKLEREVKEKTSENNLLKQEVKMLLEALNALHTE